MRLWQMRIEKARVFTYNGYLETAAGGKVPRKGAKTADSGLFLHTR